MTTTEADQNSTQVIFCYGVNSEYDVVVQMYDVEKDEWYPEITITEAKRRFVMPFNGKVYIINSITDRKDDQYGIELRTYDLQTNESETNEYLATGYLGEAIGIYGHYVYFITTLFRNISRFNLNDNTFEDPIAILKEYHDEAQATVFLNDRLYILGVLYSNYEESDCEVYDLETDEVKPIAPYPVTTEYRKNHLSNCTPTSKISAAAFAGKLYTMEEHTLRYMYVYTPEKDEWETITNLYPPGIESGHLVTCNGKLICADRIMNVHVYDPETNSWDSRTDYNGAMSYIRSVTAVDKPITDN